MGSMKRQKSVRTPRRRVIDYPPVKFVTGKIDPTQGIARMAMSMDPPKGYAFKELERNGTDWKITYVRRVP
jgi:hypothetical protein